jgi:hypothetical protein
MASLVTVGIIAATFLVSPVYAEEPVPASNGEQSQKSDDRLECPSTWLESIEDDAPLRKVTENREEYYAYNLFVTHAHKIAPELLAKNARKELTFRLLYGDERSKYRGEIVHVQGRLKRLIWIGSNPDLMKAGIKDVYEAWIFEAAYFSNPTCVVLTELPPGLETGEDIRNVWVACDGYFFKRLMYDTPEINEKTKRPVKRLAPFVIGHTASLYQPEISEAEKQSDLWSYFVPVLIICAFGMVGLAFFLHRWFVSGDRKAHAALQNAKPTEFVAPTEPPAYRDYPQEPSAN